MNHLQRSLQHYFQKSSNQQIALVFAGVGAVAAFLTFLYVYFIGQNSDYWVLRYFMTILFFAGGVIFVVMARNAKDGFAGLAYAILAFFLFFSMLVSVIVSLILFAFFL